MPVSKTAQMLEIETTTDSQPHALPFRVLKHLFTMRSEMWSSRNCHFFNAPHPTATTTMSIPKKTASDTLNPKKEYANFRKMK